MGAPTMGWRTWRPRRGGGVQNKAPGTLLSPEGEQDGNHSVQVRDGGGWKKGLKFLRLWNEDTRAYTVLCLDGEDNLVATALAGRDADVWTNIAAALRHKGYSPGQK